MFQVGSSTSNEVYHFHISTFQSLYDLAVIYDNNNGHVHHLYKVGPYQL